MNKTVVVLGGTGHIGAALARRFAQGPWHVIATGRRDKPRPNLDGTSVDIRIGDDTNPETVAQWCAKADLIIDAATPYPIALHQDRQNDPTAQAVARSQTLLKTAQTCGAAFVHISSFTTLPRTQTVMGQIGQGVLQGLHSYFTLKQQVETHVHRALHNGLSGCILNPSTCLGPYDLKPLSQTFIPQLLSGQVQGLVKHDLNVVDVRDVADIAFAATAQGFPTRQIPIFGHSLSLQALATQICQLGNVAPPRLQLPALMGLTGMYWMETAFAITGRQSPWPSLPMMLLSASYAARPSAAQAALLAQPRPLQTTLSDAIDWYRDIGYLKDR